MKQLYRLLIAALLLSTLLGVSVLRADAQDPQPVVHAVLFYSPSCTHCQFVINEVLPPLTHKYGPQLQMIGFDISQPQGEAMFHAALERFGVQQPSVPLLVIDNIPLIGSEEIPDRFPALIESYLKLGGVAWPDIPGLREMLIAAAQAATAEASNPASSQTTVEAPAPGPGTVERAAPGWRERFAADVTANSIAVALLLGMFGALVWALIRFRLPTGPSIHDKVLSWVIPSLCLLGLIIAGYLAYVEATDASPICGPIGNCNAVQQSPYSRLFGVLSIGAVSLVGYTLILIAWALTHASRSRVSVRATLVLFLLALLGTLLSMYLTFLEPFVIGATCAWCLTSATLMAVLMLLSAGPAGMALQSDRIRDRAQVTGARKPRLPRLRKKRPSSRSGSR